MSYINVRFGDSFQLEGKSFSPPQMLVSDLESSVNSKIFIPSSAGETSVRFSFLHGIEVLRAKGVETLSSIPSQVRRRANRIADWARHMGVVADPKLSLSKESQEQIESMKPQSQLGWKGSLVAISDVTAEMGNILLNPFTGGRGNRIVGAPLGIASGIFWLFLGAREAKIAIKEREEAREIGDTEGVRRATAKLYTGNTLGAGSVGFLAAKGCALSSAHGAKIASGVMGSLATSLFGFGSVIGIGMSVLGVVRCRNFATSLNTYLEDARFSEETRVRGAIRFLRDSVRVTEREKQDLVHDINKDYPEKSDSEKDALLREKIKRMTAVKVRCTKRRTSVRAISQILHQADAILDKLDSSNPDIRNEGLEEAHLLIGTVKTENKRKSVLYAVSLVASLIAAVGVIISTFFSLGIVPLVLYVLSMLICISICGIAALSKAKDPSTPIEIKKEI